MQKLRVSEIRNTQLLHISLAYFNCLWYIIVEVMKMTLRELRKQNKLTQAQCAAYLGVPLRTYQNYENDESKRASFKYQYMMQKLEAHKPIDEDHGILSLRQIREACANVFSNYDVDYCYLFGSYAKGTATESSDVDLLVASNVTGMRFFDMVESIREILGKRVDVLNFEQLKDNIALTYEILKDGVKIYG